MKIPIDPDYQKYISKLSSLYNEKNYDSGLTGFCLRKSHEIAERAFGKDIFFKKVLEVGAGTGEHFQHIEHAFEEYWMTDLHQEFLNRANYRIKNHFGNILFGIEDASKLSFSDNTFDRVIAAHILEHLSSPHLVLREWVRVLRPGGILTLVLPCDPGCAWRLGRTLIVRRKHEESGLEYDYWMAREHVNSINNLVAYIEYYFPKRRDIWWPFRMPSVDVNLFYITHISLNEDE